MWYQSLNKSGTVRTPMAGRLRLRDLEVPVRVTRSNSEDFVMPPKKVWVGQLWVGWALDEWGFVRLWNVRLGRGRRMDSSIQLEIVTGYRTSIEFATLWWPSVIYNSRLPKLPSLWLVQTMTRWLKKINIMVRARYICTVLVQMCFGGRILHFRVLVLYKFLQTDTSIFFISKKKKKTHLLRTTFEFPRMCRMESIEPPRKFPRSVPVGSSSLDWNPFSKEIVSCCIWIGKMIDRSQYCNKQRLYISTCGFGCMFVVE